MPKHTPGPWHTTGKVWSGNTNQPAGIFSGTPNERGGWSNSQQVWPPYDCDPRGDTYARHAADLRLMAAAPDLLSACETVLKHLPDKGIEGSWDYESAILLRKAIAKATGASQ